MSQTKKIQGKIFRGVVETKEDTPSRSNTDPNLSINIPKPAAPASSSVQIPKADAPQNADKSTGTFRQRVLQKLGPEYHSAERYRLVQDDKKEKHWKRWGPYVSDRQWVSFKSHQKSEAPI